MKDETIIFDYAGFSRRFLAFIIDFVILILLLFLIFFIEFLRSGGEDNWQVSLLFPILAYLYFVVFELSSWRGTFGKRALKIQVIHCSGRSLQLSESLLRTLAKVLTICTLGIGLLFIFVNTRKQALHDMIVSTCVVMEQVERKDFKDIYVRCLKKMKERRLKDLSDGT